MATIKWYSLKNILAKKAVYNMIIGKRSNGKTFAVQEKIIEDYVNFGHQGAIIRRWEEDYRGRRGQATFQALVDKGIVTKLTKGEWTGITYRSAKWYFSKYDSDLDKIIISEVPFCYAFALTMAEHDKSTSYPNVKNILFDEFITRYSYLPEEFMLFTNVLSTIIRERDDVVIFMLGNTINKYCPYFAEMNIDVSKQEQGTIEVYKYVGHEDLTVAVEYCGEGKSKTNRLGSDKYFGFDNPKLQMVTKGLWEIANYPHIPIKYTKDNIIYQYIIKFQNEVLMCNIIAISENIFTFIHKWTSGIPNNMIVYSTEYSSNPFYHRRITKPMSKIERFIAKFFVNEKIFYSTNEVGEIVRNYLQWCNTDKGIQ